MCSSGFSFLEGVRSPNSIFFLQADEIVPRSLFLPSMQALIICCTEYRSFQRNEYNTRPESLSPFKVSNDAECWAPFSEIKDGLSQVTSLEQVQWHNPVLDPYLVELGYFIGNCHLPIAKLWVVRSWHGHKKQPFPASRPSICSNNFANSSTIKIDAIVLQYAPSPSRC